MARLEGSTHHTGVTSAVKGVVTAAIGHLNQLVLDGLALLQFGGVHKVRGTELLRPVFLGVVNVYDNNLGGLVLDGALDDGQTDAAGAEDGDVGALLDATLASGDGGGAVTGGDAAAEQAGAVHGGLLLGDGDDGDVGDDGVLREGRGAHEVQQVLALAAEARGAVGHEALALRRADLAAEVGLARLAELALLALWGAVGCERADAVSCRSRGRGGKACLFGKIPPRRATEAGPKQTEREVVSALQSLHRTKAEEARY